MMNRPKIKSLVFHGLWERIQYPGLLVVLAAFWMALAGFFGSTAFGFPYLFWHADAEIALCAGLAIGVFLGEWCFVNFTLDSDRLWMRQWVATDSDQNVLMRYLFWTNLLFAGLFLPTPFFYRMGHDLVQFNLVRAGMSAMAIVTGVTLYVCLVNGLAMLVRCERWGMPKLRENTAQGMLLLRRRHWLRHRHHESSNDTPAAEATASQTDTDQEGRSVRDGTSMVWIHTVSGLLFGLWACLLGLVSVVYVMRDGYSSWLEAVLSPGVLTCALLIIGIRVYGFLVYHLQRLYYAFAFSVVALYVCVSYYDWFGHKYELPGIDPKQQFATAEEVLQLQHSRVVKTEQGHIRDTDAAALQAWQRATEADRRPPILVIVAASGGGIRASIWTTAVLGALERMIPEMPYQTRLVTGASGGMVGAAGYVGSLARPDERDAHQIGKRAWPVEQIVESAATDSLTPTARTLFFRDLPRQFFPWLGGRDRGETLQSAWVQASGGKDSPLGQPLDALREGELSGWRPSLVFTPSLLEDGKRLVVSNLNMSHLTVDELAMPELETHGPLTTRDYANASLTAIEAKLLEEELGYRMDLATAARLNASFPLISPTISLPVDGVQWSLADAAFFDNYGIDTTARWLNRHRERLLQWRDEGKLSGILVVQIVSADEPRNQVPQDMPKWTDGWLTPLAGIFVHVMQKMVFTGDEQLEQIAQEFNSGSGSTDDFFHHSTISFRGQTSLSWYLTPEEIRSLVFPFENRGGEGQLDFHHYGSVEFHALLERSGAPTQEMLEFREQIQSQLEQLHEWWDDRSYLWYRDQVNVTSRPIRQRREEPGTSDLR